MKFVTSSAKVERHSLPRELQITELVLDGLTIGGRYSAIDCNALGHDVMISRITILASKPFWPMLRISYDGVGDMMNETSANRASRRIDVHYDAVLITSDGHEVRVVVKDLSAEGFRIEIDEQLEVGEQIILRTDRGGDVPAQIAWALGLEAGGIFLAKSEVA